MQDVKAIADRVEIEALRGEFTDAAMMRAYDRLASLFTLDGALRMPNIPPSWPARNRSAPGARIRALVDFLVQNTHPGTIALDGDTATGRAYIHEAWRARDGRQGLNYAICTTATGAPQRAGSSPSASTRSVTRRPHRWRARRAAPQVRRRRPGTPLRWTGAGDR